MQQSKYQFRHELNPSVPSKSQRDRQRNFQSGQPWSKPPKQSWSRPLRRLLFMLIYSLVQFANVEPSQELQLQAQEEASGPSPRKIVERGKPTSKDLSTMSIIDTTSDLAIGADENGNVILHSADDSALASYFPSESPHDTTYSFDRLERLWPLRNKDEAFLLQYFSTDLALWVNSFHHISAMNPNWRQSSKMFSLITAKRTDLSKRLSSLQPRHLLPFSMPSSRSQLGILALLKASIVTRVTNISTNV